jgi:hypothetical protein
MFKAKPLVINCINRFFKRHWAEEFSLSPQSGQRTWFFFGFKAQQSKRFMKV